MFEKISTGQLRIFSSLSKKTREQLAQYSKKELLALIKQQEEEEWEKNKFIPIKIGIVKEDLYSCAKINESFDFSGIEVVNLSMLDKCKVYYKGTTAILWKNNIGEFWLVKGEDPNDYDLIESQVPDGSIENIKDINQDVKDIIE